MLIALAQIASSAVPAENLRLIGEAVTEAAAHGAELVVFPEATQAHFGVDLGAIAEPVDGPWATAVGEIARRAGVTVVVGMFTPAVDGRVHNTLLVSGPDVLASYDKIHVYDAFGYRESDTVEPGAEPVVFTVGDVTVGLATCYDVRFPELFRANADRGAQVTVLPASWGDGPGKAEQWELLVRARALDATSYVVAVDQADPIAAGLELTGSDPRGIGLSRGVAPDGTVGAALEAKPGLGYLEADPDRVAAARRQNPVLANRRLG